MAAQVNRHRLKLVEMPVSPRLLFVGPASSGKTYLGTLIGELINRPVYSCNMATVTPEGFKGGNLMESLVGAAKAKGPGIIVIDEIDKVIRRDGKGGWANQLDFSLLPLLGGEEVTIPLPDGRGVIKQSFRDWIIILSGVFPEVRPEAWSNIYSARKAVNQYGFSGELVSRLTHVFKLSEIPKANLVEIARKEAQHIGKLYGFKESDKALSEWQLKGIVHRSLKGGYGLRTIKSEIYDLIAQNSLTDFHKKGRHSKCLIR